MDFRQFYLALNILPMNHYLNSDKICRAKYYLTKNDATIFVALQTRLTTKVSHMEQNEHQFALSSKKEIMLSSYIKHQEHLNCRGNSWHKKNVATRSTNQPIKVWFRIYFNLSILVLSYGCVKTCELYPLAYTTETH